jgi:ribosomal protein S18 acetylase RimI-like enzyme
MSYARLSYNCGAMELGEWERTKIISKELQEEYEKEIKTLVDQAEASWHKMIICTVLKDQVYIRKLLRKYGFKKTPEALSKYKKTNTQCIYYWDTNAIKKKVTK